MMKKLNLALGVALAMILSLTVPNAIARNFDPGSAKKSNIHAVNVQLRRQMSQLKKDAKSGKVTQDQAKIIFEKLKAVRKQELEYFRLNGQKEVTADQKAQLNQLLAQTASLI
jgi:hypothetical protein